MDNAKPQSTQWTAEPSHESSDVDIKWILISLLFLIAGAVVMHAFLGSLMAFYHWERNRTHLLAREQTVVPAIVDSRSRVSPPQRQLQLAPREELKALRDQEDKQLNSYGWIDQKTGIVHIPIDNAKDLLLQRGLPVRGHPGAPTPEKSALELIQERAEESK